MLSILGLGNWYFMVLEGVQYFFYVFTCLHNTANVSYYLYMISVGNRNIVLLQTIAAKHNS